MTATEPPEGVPLTDETKHLLETGDRVRILYDSIRWRNRMATVVRVGIATGIVVVRADDDIADAGFDPGDLEFVTRPSYCDRALRRAQLQRYNELVAQNGENRKRRREIYSRLKLLLGQGHTLSFEEARAFDQLHAEFRERP